MKKTLFCIILPFIISCSSYKTTIEIEKGSKLSKLKKSGIIYRTSVNNSIQQDEYTKSLLYWLEGSKKINNYLIVPVSTENIHQFASNSDRFYQLDIDDQFLRYKAIGVISFYLRTNEDQLKKIMAENGLDSLIIYEVVNEFSAEMQHYDFETMLIVVNSNLELLYMDKQMENSKTFEFDSQVVKRHLLDRISNRLLEKMIELNYVEKK